MAANHYYGWGVDKAHTHVVAEITDLTYLGIAEADLGDPEADRLLGWDESAATSKWFTAQGGIRINGTNLELDPNATPTFATLLLTTVKSGVTQAAAGAAAGELWKTLGHATLPDNVVCIGV
jgi:hypothetical protein